MDADTDYPSRSCLIKSSNSDTINGPWAWYIGTSKVNYGAKRYLPTFKGQPPKPFVGVLTGINAASQRELAVLENYLLRRRSEAVNQDKPLGA